MVKPERGILEADSPATATKRTFGSVWRSYRSEPNSESGYSGMPLHRRAFMNALARLKFRHVRHATFEQLSSAGYNVQTYDDGTARLEPEKIARKDFPEQWKTPIPVIAPKVATLRDAVLFMDGSALLPDGHFCWFDTHFTRHHWRTPGKFDVRPTTFLYADRATDSALIRRHLLCIDVPGRCFSLRVKYWENFAHFVHDVLSRIYYEDLGAIVPGRDRVIAPPMPWPMQNALFRKIFEGYEIVHVPHHVALRVEELLLPANLCRRESFNSAAIAALAKRMRRIMAPYAGKEKYKVCVSRKDASPARRIRHKRNFANIEDYENRMRKLGYLIVNASEIAPEEQFKLWPNTTDIVGIHGSGMMNMIMMQSGGNYTEITGVKKGDPRGELITNSIVRCPMAAGHRVGGLACPPDADGRQKIDLDRLEALLLDAY